MATYICLSHSYNFNTKEKEAQFGPQHPCNKSLGGLLMSALSHNLLFKNIHLRQWDDILGLSGLGPMLVPLFG